MHSKARFQGIALLVLALSSPSLPAAEKWTQYTNFSGINAMSDGGRHLWMATTGGLVRMDKASGETSYFNQANSALPDSRVQILDCDTAGRLAAVTRSGILVEYDGRAWSNLSSSFPLQGHHVLDVGWAPGGDLWVLAADFTHRLPHLLHRCEGEWTRVDLEGARALTLGTYGYAYSYGSSYSYGYYGYALPYLQVDRFGRACAVVTMTSARQKLFRASADGTVETFSAPPQELYPRLFVLGKSGTFHWLCSRVLATPAADSGWDTLAFPPGMYPSAQAHPRNILAHAADGGEYWAFTRLLRRDGREWSAVPFPGDTASYTSPLLIQSSDGGGATPANRPWQGLCAGRGAKLYALEREALTTASIAKLPLGSTSSYRTVLPRGSGSAEVLLGGYSSIQSLDPRTSTSNPLDLSSTGISSFPALITLGESPDGAAWFSSYNSLVRLGPEGARALTPPDTSWVGMAYFTTGGVGYMATDATGSVWLADGNRLISVPRGSANVSTWRSHWLPHPWNNGGSVSALAAHPDGSLWLAIRPQPDFTTSDAPYGLLGRYDGKTWTLFNGAHHPWIGAQPTADIRCDGAGNVWARYAKGVLQWDGTSWKEHAYGTAPGLPTRISAMAVDPGGRLWAAADLPDAQLLRWTGQWEAVAESRGVIGASMVTSMAFDKTGRLWMTLSGNGVLAYAPSGEHPTSMPAIRTGPASGRASLAPRTDGSWRLDPGPLGGGTGLGLRVLDLSGRPMPGTESHLVPTLRGDWIWPGAGGVLPAGKYLLSVHDRAGHALYLPFLHAGKRIGR